MEEFTVDRKKIVWLPALAGVLALVYAARNGAGVDQFSTMAVTRAATMAAPEAGTAVGVFEGHGGVGTVLHPGAVEYDAAKGSYAIAGSREKMGLATDSF